MEISVVGKKVLVTGAGQGIGHGIVKKLYQSGAIVYALTKSPENMQRLQAEFPNIKPVLVDLVNWEETEEKVGAVEPLDYLVNCAGVDVIGTFLDATKDDIQSTFDVNVRALNQVTQIVARRMIEAGAGGSIVNICAILVGGSIFSTYTASKAAVKQLTKNMAVHLGEHQIRVNSLSPTFVLTDKVKEILTEPEPAAMAEQIRQRTPLGRFCSVDDVVNSILFLLSDQANMITGANLVVDGGLSAK